MGMRTLTAGLGILGLLAVGVAPAAVADSEEETYILFSGGHTLPPGLEEKVEQAGGSVTAAYPFGVAVVDAGADFEGVPGTTMVEDTGLAVATGPTYRVAATGAGLPPESGDDDELLDLQWGHVAVGALEAWDAGVRGQGVRVAVLDTGFDLDHPDLAPNINLGLSRDFTGEGLDYAPSDVFSHGTHVAGTIAAADNGQGTIGVAPEAELVLVKVLADRPEDNDGLEVLFSEVLAGFYYATSVDADVISMSLGIDLPRTRDVTALAVVMNKAMNYAYHQGTTVVVAAGNAAADMDGDGDMVRFLASAPHVIGVSAFAPVGWATPDWDGDLFRPTSYTNYGTSMIDLSGPGGDVRYPGDESCTVAGLERPCFYFDLVFSTGGNDGYYWEAGTSMATPHVAGVAALIISEHGGDLKPQHVLRELRQRALDKGKPGADDFHGRGAVHTGY